MEITFSLSWNVFCVYKIKLNFIKLINFTWHGYPSCFVSTVDCPVSNHFYFKADSKYLLGENKISALFLQSTIIPLNNETRFASLCLESYNNFEVDRQLV